MNQNFWPNESSYPLTPVQKRFKELTHGTVIAPGRWFVAPLASDIPDDRVTERRFSAEWAPTWMRLAIDGSVVLGHLVGGLDAGRTILMPPDQEPFLEFTQGDLNSVRFALGYQSRDAEARAVFHQVCALWHIGFALDCELPPRARVKFTLWRAA